MNSTEAILPNTKSLVVKYSPLNGTISNGTVFILNKTNIVDQNQTNIICRLISVLKCFLTQHNT